MKNITTETHNIFLNCLQDEIFCFIPPRFGAKNAYMFISKFVYFQVVLTVPSKRLELRLYHFDSTGADPEFFLGGGALVSCSTSTPINHIVFFFFFYCRIPIVLENRRSSQGRGGAHPLHPPPGSAPVAGSRNVLL